MSISTPPWSKFCVMLVNASRTSPRRSWRKQPQRSERPSWITRASCRALQRNNSSSEKSRHSTGSNQATQGYRRQRQTFTPTSEQTQSRRRMWCLTVHFTRTIQFWGRMRPRWQSDWWRKCPGMGKRRNLVVRRAGFCRTGMKWTRQDKSATRS